MYCIQLVLLLRSVLKSKELADAGKSERTPLGCLSFGNLVKGEGGKV